LLKGSVIVGQFFMKCPIHRVWIQWWWKIVEFKGVEHGGTALLQGLAAIWVMDFEWQKKWKIVQEMDWALWRKVIVLTVHLFLKA